MSSRPQRETVEQLAEQLRRQMTTPTSSAATAGMSSTNMFIREHQPTATYMRAEEHRPTFTFMGSQASSNALDAVFQESLVFQPNVPFTSSGNDTRREINSQSFGVTRMVSAEHRRRVRGATEDDEITSTDMARYENQRRYRDDDLSGDVVRRYKLTATKMCTAEHRRRNKELSKEDSPTFMQQLHDLAYGRGCRSKRNENEDEDEDDT